MFYVFLQIIMLLIIEKFKQLSWKVVEVKVMKMRK